MTRYALPLLLFSLLAFGPREASAQPQPSADEFVPVAEAPPGEQIPAINLVGAAYGFVWVVLVGYVWTLGRRMSQAERDLAALEQRRS
jgi:CcmD family protein